MYNVEAEEETDKTKMSVSTKLQRNSARTMFAAAAKKLPSDDDTLGKLKHNYRFAVSAGVWYATLTCKQRTNRDGVLELSFVHS